MVEPYLSFFYRLCKFLRSSVFPVLISFMCRILTIVRAFSPDIVTALPLYRFSCVKGKRYFHPGSLDLPRKPFLISLLCGCISCLMPSRSTSLKASSSFTLRDQLQVRHVNPPGLKYVISGICSTSPGHFGLPLHFFIGHLSTVYDKYITISIFKSKVINIYDRG